MSNQVNDTIPSSQEHPSVAPSSAAPTGTQGTLAGQPAEQHGTQANDDTAASASENSSASILDNSNVVIPSPESVSSVEPDQPLEDDVPINVARNRTQGDDNDTVDAGVVLDVTDTEDDSSEEESDDDIESVVDESQLQWEESMNQLNGLLTFVLIPVIGRVIGRRVANLIWRNIAKRIWS